MLFGLRDSVLRPTLFNPWDAVHLLVGAAVCVLLRYATDKRVDGWVVFLLALLVHSSYELGDVQRRIVYGSCEKSLLDSLGDTYSFCVGYAIGLAVEPTRRNAVLVWVPIVVLVFGFLTVGESISQQ